MKIKIGRYSIDAKIVAKGLIFSFNAIIILILLYGFMKNGVDWVGFVEFTASCLLLIFLVEKIHIKVPGLFEIKTELGEIRRNLSVVAQNISNVKINNKITTVTPTFYEGPPIDIDSATTTLYTGTVDDPTEEIEVTEEE